MSGKSSVKKKNPSLRMCTDIGLAVTEQRQDTEEMEMGEIQWDGPCWSEVSGC